MDIKDVKNLVKVITETDITEFEMENGQEKIVIRRGQRTEVVHVAPAVAQAPVVQAGYPAPIQEAASVIVAVAENEESIKSPIVGTFYAAPSPDASPYVQAGQVVEKGQTLCIVEAMKLMNEIEAEYRCRIVKVCKENAQAVEYGDPLFVVERQ